MKSATAASSGTFTYGYSTTTDKKDIVSGSASFSGNLQANTVSLDNDYASHKFTFSLDLSNVSSKLTESTKSLEKYNDESKIYTYEISNITPAAWETTANITDEIGFEVVQNSNTISYSLSTDSKLQASFDAIPSYYIVSSLNNLDANEKSEGVAAATKKCNINDITNSDITVVGAHPIYTTGLVGSGGISINTNDSSFNDDAEQEPLESWKVDGEKYESLELITNANKKIIPNKLAANSVTNGTDAFYMYIGFGVEQVDGAKVTGNKIVLLPEGWYVDKLEENDNKYVSGPVVWEGVAAKKFDTGIPVYRVTKATFDLCPPLINMKSAGNIEYIEGSNDLFKVKNPTTGHKHNYTAWCFENAGAKDLIRIKISKTVNNFTDDDLTQ